MNRLNILELHRTLNEKKQKKYDCFEKILDSCHKRIKYQTEHYKLNYFYEVPLYVVGFPIYDISLCIQYLIDVLEKEGFLVKYFFPKYLYVSWDFDEISSENNNNKYVKYSKNSNLLANGQLLADPLLPRIKTLTSDNLRENKKKTINNDIQKYTKNNPDILSYKPSGKLQLNLL
jgi:hypothetical protein